MKWPVLMALAAASLLMSCMVGPNYTRPAQPLPKHFIAGDQPKTTATAAVKFGQTQHFNAINDIPAQWWELFHSKPLNDLILASFQHNPNVGVAKAGLHSALEAYYVQQGSLFPFVGVSFSPTKQQTANILTSVLASNDYNYALYTGQVFVSYTADAFGGIRRQLESLKAQAALQRFQLQATYLTLASNVVNAAIQEAALREQIAITRQIIASQARLLSILRQEQDLGDVAKADIAMQETALASSEAALIPLQKQLALQRDLLNALTGRFPDDVSTPTFSFSSLALPTDLPRTLPSRLLEQRPDLRAAEAQMQAANALIGVAVANRLPNITIAATNAGTSATTLSSLLSPDTQFWALAGLIAQPIFDGGALKHKQRLAETQYQQAAANYRATVINAFQNVADTLNSIHLDAQALRLASNAAQAASTSYTITGEQYQMGDASLFKMLNNEQIYFQAQLNLIKAQADRLSDTVALFQAVGGGCWHPTKPSS